MSLRLHIVSFNVPLPADYGGVIDVFYRLRTLSHMGVEVELHCFDYGRGVVPELERYCTAVHYYKRRTGLRSAIGRRPYIVQSRDCKALVEDLRKDNAPILLEGLHCCAVLEVLTDRGGRRIFVRAHNVEHDYYEGLARAERSLWRRLYYRLEARRLRAYEPVLRRADAVLAITKADAEHFVEMGCREVVLMPASHPFDEVTSLAGQGDYALYHADLSVAENEQAVLYLADTLFERSDYRFVVAGRCPSHRLKHRLVALPNVELVETPDERRMQELIANAQVLLLVTAQATGLKLKLLNSLYVGRHCLVNSMMIAGTTLAGLCHVADSPESQRAMLDTLMHTPFTEEEVQRRRTLLSSAYSNEANTKQLVDLLAASTS